MPDVREVYEMVTKQKAPQPGALERQQKRQVRTARNRKVGALAVAAAIGVTAVALVLGTRGDQDALTPLGEPEPTTTVYPVDPKAEEVSTEFVQAFGAFDGQRAITYLADDAYLEMDATTPEAVPVFTAFLEAQGYEQIAVEECSVTGTSSSGTAVRCPFDWHAIRSDEIGLGPYPGYWDLTVRDGEIVAVRLYWEIKKFSPQVWEPFRDWVSKNHPKDFDAMYTGGGTNFQLTEESIRLWREHTHEYVRDVAR